MIDHITFKRNSIEKGLDIDDINKLKEVFRENL
jgi:hypothetical protein